jgi:hypothetical protein
MDFAVELIDLAERLVDLHRVDESVALQDAIDDAIGRVLAELNEVLAEELPTDAELAEQAEAALSDMPWPPIYGWTEG